VQAVCNLLKAQKLRICHMQSVALNV
jgi:hypothetical protein